MSASTGSRYWLLWLFVILALTLGVYAPSFRNGYTYDDAGYVQVPNVHGLRNEMVADWQGVGTYFTSRYGDKTGNLGRGFRPVTVISFAVVHQWFETASSAAMQQHAANVLLFLVATWIMFEILSRFVGRGWPALLGTLVFGLHVVRSDPVIAIVGRAEILGFLFGGAGTLLYLHVLQCSGIRRYASLGLASVCMFLALCSKESAAAWIVFAPLTALALGWQRPEWRSHVTLRKQCLPWLVATMLPAIAFGSLMYVAVSANWGQELIFPEQNALVDVAPIWRLANAVMILAFGLYKVVFPFFPSCDYGSSFDLVGGLGDYRLWLAATLLGGLLSVGLFCARRAPLLFLAVAAFFGFSFMTSNLAFVVETIFAERLLFTPAISLSLVVALVASVTVTRYRRLRLPLVILLGLWVACGLVVIPRQCQDWYSDETLFVAHATRHPGSSSLQIKAGRVHRMAGEKTDFQGAEGRGHRLDWKKYASWALRADPESVAALEELAVWNLLHGNSLRNAGRAEDATQHFNRTQMYVRRAFASPQFRKILQGPRLHQMQGDLHYFAGALDKAETAYRESIAARPDRAESYQNLANFLYGQKRSGDAERVMEEGLANQPKSVLLRESVMRTALSRKDWPGFERLLADGAKLIGQNPIMTILRGRMLHARDRIEEAVRSLEAGLKAAPFEDFGYDWMCLAECLESLDKLSESRDIWQRLEQSPKMPAEIRGKARKKLQKAPQKR